MEKSIQEKPYEKPAVVDHGDLRELTEAGIKRGHFDGTYEFSHTVTFVFSHG